MAAQCPFCSPVPKEIVLRNSLCYTRYDRYPVSKGHVLIVPFRHVVSFFDLTEVERDAAFDLVQGVKAKLNPALHPDGYNLGVNVGQAAGQTVMHTHIHLIPRYHGDVPDPRGGVRFVIPQKAKYCDQSPVQGGDRK
jgi:diadenosine tetraphosphate (Ap4A) HIT family hydrolase